MKRRWFGLLLVFAAFVAGVLILGALLRGSNRTDKTETALKALCAQREDLDAQIAASEKLLHPKSAKEVAEAKVVFKAIPRSLILSTLQARKKFRENLNILDC